MAATQELGKDSASTRLGARRLLVATVAFVFLAQALYLGFAIRADHIASAERAGQTTRQMAEMIEEGIKRTLDTSDLVLQRALDAMHNRSLPDIAADAELGDKLRAMAAQLPYIGFITLFDREGRPVVSTTPALSRSFSVADRDYFKAHSERNIGDVFIGPLLVGRVNNKRVFTMSRPLRRGDGSFLGVMVVGVDGAYFSGMVNGLDRGPNGGTTLYKADGTLLMREPLDETQIGKSFARLALFTELLPRARAGTFETTSPFDGVLRIVSYQASDRWPVVVVSTAGKADAMAQWNERTQRALLLMGGEAAVVLSLILLTMRSLEQQEMARRAADRANRAKTEFLAAMSHELRTPLNAIIGFSELMTFDGIPAAQRDDYANYIHESGVHLLSLVNEVLDFSAVEAGRVELQVTEVDVNALATAAERLVAPRAERKGLTMAVDLAEAPARLRIDERRIKQVLVNLLGNAVKFTPDGGKVSLRMASTPEGGVEIAVTDTGVGMSEEDITVALADFGRVAGPYATQNEGTGLGLPLSQRLVELHGGTLDLDSQPGHGTCVTVRLPAACVVGVG